MIPFRQAALVFAAALLAVPAFADDAATAAAAMQAIGQAVPGGVPPSGATTEKKNSNGFRELSAPRIEKKAGGGKKSGAKKSKAKRTSSKYKSTELAGSAEHNYRFDENAEPLDIPKKKAAAKKKKASTEPAVCTDEDPCPVKNSDADAL